MNAVTETKIKWYLEHNNEGLSDTACRGTKDFFIEYAREVFKELMNEREEINEQHII